MHKILLIFIGLFLSISLFAKTTFPKSEIVPGGIAVIPLDCEKHPKAFFKHHRVMVVKKKGRWHAIFGIPLNNKKEKINLIVKIGHVKSKIPIIVSKKSYSADHLTFKHKKHSKKANIRIAKRVKEEKKRINKLFSTWSNKKHINMCFKIPVKGRFSCPFGFHRFINGKPHGSHLGLDIAANKGTKVRAPSSGKVIDTHNYLLTGKTVFIDHGQGLVTVYAHLNKISVKKHQKVKRGQVIGKVGSTGRSTGYHLHWGVSLNGTRVNPLLFVAQV